MCKKMCDLILKKVKDNGDENYNENENKNKQYN